MYVSITKVHFPTSPFTEMTSIYTLCAQVCVIKNTSLEYENERIECHHSCSYTVCAQVSVIIDLECDETFNYKLTWSGLLA